MFKIGPITNQLIETFINEFKKDDNKAKINENVIYPILYDITYKVYPYFISFFLLQIIILFLILYKK
jgi:hypothetical protein